LSDEILAQSINIIKEETQHLNEFVQECLNFVRPVQKVRSVEVDINEVIYVTLNIITHIFENESKTVRVVTEMDPNLPKIYSNYEEIKQALLNIIKNAYEAMPMGGELWIKTIQESGSPRHVEMIFVDNGVGIKKEALPSLFHPFFTTKPLGTGLGLAVCRRIISERNNGKIFIESEEGKGTTVRVRLPIDRRLEDPLEKTDGI